MDDSIEGEHPVNIRLWRTSGKMDARMLSKGPNAAAKRAQRREAERPTAGPLLGAPLEPLVMPPRHWAVPTPETPERRGDTSARAPAPWHARHRDAHGRSRSRK